MIEKLRRKLRLWLFPKSDYSAVTISVSLEGYEEMAKQLKDLERRLERIAKKADAAAAALDRLDTGE